MENTLKNLISKEKRKTVVRSLIAAFIIAGLVLGISFALNLGDENLVSDTNGDDNTDQTLSYVQQLNSEIETKFATDEIDGFYIHGNATDSVYPGLLESYIVPFSETAEWNVTAIVVEDVDNYPSDLTYYNFNFSSIEINEVHNSFLNSLNNTEEVPRGELPSDVGSIPSILFYNILYTDGTGLSFLWLGFESTDIIEVANITWSGAPNNISFDQSESRYLSPLSAFDSFRSTLQQLYTQNIESSWL